MKKGLGRGLDALFGENTYDVAEKNGITEARLSQIEPDKNQPRRDFDEQALAQLANSIKQHGIISPIAVRRLDEDRYAIIAGERRWRAARLAGLESVPIIIKDYENSEITEVSLVENIVRENLNPVEQALGFKRLIEQYGLTQEQVASRVSKSRSAVTNALRLLSLPEGVLDFLRTGELTAGHARALVSLEDADKVLELANKIIVSDLSVRQTEQLVKKVLSKKRPPVNLDSEVTAALEQLEKKAEQAVGSRVKIKYSPNNKGRVEIFFHSNGELEKIITALSGDAEI